MRWIGEIIGAIAIVVSMLIYQQKSRAGLLVCKLISDVLWITHYILLGGFTGAAVTGVALVRGLVFFKSNPKDKNGKWILLSFMGISILCTILTWKSVFSIFALLGSAISIISFWIGNPRLSRRLAFPVAVSMLIYGASNGSVTVIVNETLVMLSSVLGIVRYDIKKNVK